MVRFSELAKAEHVGHRIQSGLLVARPKCGLDGTLREHRPVLGSVRQLDAFHRARKNHAVVAGDGAASQRRKADITSSARTGLAVASARGMRIERYLAARCGG